MMNIPYGGGMNGGDYGGANNPALLQPPMTQEYHSLDCSWTIWVIDPTKKQQITQPNQAVAHDDYLSTLDNLGTFSTVEDFWLNYHKLRVPSKMPPDTTYHLFKTGISPTWEDPINVNGGKWVLTFQASRQLYNFDIDLIWENIVLGIVGETIDTERDICGVVLQKREKLERISIWNRDASNQEGIENLKSNILNSLPSGLNTSKVNIKYQTHNLNNSQSNTQNNYQSSSNLTSSTNSTTSTFSNQNSITNSNSSSFNNSSTK